MKKYIIVLLVIVQVLCLFTACENDGFYYQDEPRVRLVGPEKWAVGTDSLEYSFVIQPQSELEFNLPVSIYIMGNAANYDRTVNLTVDNSLTTAQDKHYEMPTQVVLPANAYNVTFPLTLKRTTDLQDAGVRLYIKIAESADFKVGAIEQDHLLIKWNDMLSKPSNWDEGLTSYFGQFSIVKYRFIISTTGITEFDETQMSWAELTNYKILVTSALDEYNAANPNNPLKDENGILVTF